MKKFEWIILYLELPEYLLCSVTVGGFFKTLKEIKILKQDPDTKLVSYGLQKYIR